MHLLVCLAHNVIRMGQFQTNLLQILNTILEETLILQGVVVDEVPLKNNAYTADRS